MRYIKQFMADIAGVEIYPIISLLIFFSFFLGLTLYVISMKKKYVEYMACRPIEEGEANNPEQV
jgi:cytochrome c oxidase cbb3-type subunit 4